MKLVALSAWHQMAPARVLTTVRVFSMTQASTSVSVTADLSTLKHIASVSNHSLYLSVFISLSFIVHTRQL